MENKENKKNKKERPVINNVLITDAGAQGMSIGKVEKKVIFVPFGVPGDIVDVQIMHSKRAYFEGKICNIVQPSAYRTDAVCRYFGTCGGCKWQNMSYTKQLFYKQKIVKDNFHRLGKFPFPPLEPIIASKAVFSYRNKIEYSFADKKWLTSEEISQTEMEIPRTNALGFHLPNIFDKVLDIEYCHLHDATGNNVRNAVREFALEKGITFANIRSHSGLLRNLIIRSTTIGDIMVILVVRCFNEQAESVLQFIVDTFPELTSVMYIENSKYNDSIHDLQAHTFAGKDFMTEKMGDLEFKIAPLAFFQTNSQQAYKLYQTLLTMADAKPEDVVYDLYTGTGTIALFVAKSVKKVIGIEYIESAIESAKENATLNGITNADFYAGDTLHILTDEFIAQNGEPNIVITDPPRGGMHYKVIERLLKMSPSKIVYVSCNPATQARDIALLAEDYKVTKVQPVDMFPHTQHVENIALLEKKDENDE
ncbi:MAG: 23S rRNA (uracil(1939)-C(5))-methyltransferase RlmD [Bacteroidales bacterium]|jgi:23S rRNA (uracil1939-C5)-methyltransferase|nr:23S rRNA (uracil(1939)-C(5))-methyltransferase RlmD [Bacteroidales bacterium]